MATSGTPQTPHSNPGLVIVGHHTAAIMLLQTLKSYLQRAVGVAIEKGDARAIHEGQLSIDDLQDAQVAVGNSASAFCKSMNDPRMFAEDTTLQAMLEGVGRYIITKSEEDSEESKERSTPE